MRFIAAFIGEIAVPIRPSPTLLASLAVLTLIVLVSTGVGTENGLNPATRQLAPPAGQPPALGPAQSVATHWGTPGGVGSAALGSSAQLPTVAPLLASQSPQVNASFCDPYTGGYYYAGNSGVNFSVATTPASGAGPAPLNFHWSVQIFGGGLPPYNTSLYLVYPNNGTPPYVNQTVVSSTGGNGSTGNLTLSIPGTYIVVVSVVDSSCSQYSSVLLTEFVWGSLGANPLRSSVSQVSGTAPLNVSLQATLSGPLPANWSVAWTINADSWLSLSPPSTEWPIVAVGANASYVFFFGGTYELRPCVWEMPSPNWWYPPYACGPTSNITVVGSPYTVAFAQSPGPYPIDISFWVNRTAEPLPVLSGGQSVQLSAFVWDGTTTVGGTYPANTSATFNGSDVVCGPNWGVYFDPQGICTLRVSVALIWQGAPNSSAAPTLDNGIFGLEQADFNLTSNVTPSHWVPTVVATFDGINGTAPCNLTTNLSFSGGRAPYHYSVAVFGHAPAPNRTFLPSSSAANDSWNGSTVSLVFPLTQVGYYFASVFAQDSAGHWFTAAAPLILVGPNTTVLAPLNITPSEVLNGPVGPGGTVAFSVDVRAGAGPVAVQWAFGDGTYGSSLPGQTFEHRYALAGTYDPQVTVSAGGKSVTQALPAVEVTGNLSGPSSPSGAGGRQNPGGAHGPAAPLLLGSIAAMGASAGVAVAAYRRELRRQGQRLLRMVEEEPSSDDRPT